MSDLCPMICDFGDELMRCQLPDVHEEDSHVHAISYAEGGYGVCFFTVKAHAFMLSPDRVDIDD